MLPFRTRLTFEQRRRENERITSAHRGRVPVIAEAGSRDTPRSDKEKFLVPEDLTAAQLTFVLRRRMRLDASQSLFLLVDGALVHAHATVRELHRKHAEADGFLYATYTTENTFG